MKVTQHLETNFFSHRKLECLLYIHWAPRLINPILGGEMKKSLDESNMSPIYISQ